MWRRMPKVRGLRLLHLGDPSATYRKRPQLPPLSLLLSAYTRRPSRRGRPDPTAPRLLEGPLTADEPDRKEVFVITLSLVLFLGFIVSLLLKFNIVKIGSVVASLLFGFYLANTRAAGPINQVMTTLVTSIGN